MQYKFSTIDAIITNPIVVSFDLLDVNIDNELDRDVWGKLQTPDGSSFSVFLGVIQYTDTMTKIDVMNWCVAKLEEYKL